jgi:hypothetical protein
MQAHQKRIVVWRPAAPSRPRRHGQRQPRLPGAQLGWSNSSRACRCRPAVPSRASRWRRSTARTWIGRPGARWRSAAPGALAQPDVAGIVSRTALTTMEETAFFLQAVLAPRKPVMLTARCGPRPRWPPTVRRIWPTHWPSPPRDMCAALAWCSPGTVHRRGRRAEGARLPSTRFSSGDAGPVAYVGGALRQLRGVAAGRGARGMPRPTPRGPVRSS